ncbi:MAG: DUF4382 domain-containing protein [Deltaproteobacteria bacterium]|nr:DUF4382 domain-containing protein [Deltaproteobacteria bacterium]
MCRLLLQLVSPALGAGHCQQDPPGMGQLRLWVQAADFPDLEAVRAVGERTEVIWSAAASGSDEQRIQVSDQPLVVDLAGLGGNVPTFAGAYDVPAGFVKQVRLVVHDVVIRFEGADQTGSFDVKVPSGEQTGVKIVPEDPAQPFRIVAGGVTNVAVLFDPEVHLHHNRGQGWMMKPVIPGREIPQPPRIDRHPTRVVVALEPGATRDDLDALNADFCNSTDPPACASVQRESTAPGVFVAAAPDGRTALELFDFYRGRKPPVRFVLPEWFLHAQGRMWVFPAYVPNDYPPTAGGVHPWWWPLGQVGADEGWANWENDDETLDSQVASISPPGRGALVAVLDTGVDLEHTELWDHIWINQRDFGAAVQAVDPRSGARISTSTATAR